MVDQVFEQELEKYLKTQSPKLKTKSQSLKNLQEVVEVVADQGLSAVQGLPDWFYKVFVTTHQIAPDWHVKIQAAWQKHFDNSISKTINFPKTASIKDVENAYLLAWKAKCKGITIYRDGSYEDQVISIGESG